MWVFEGGLLARVDGGWGIGVGVSGLVGGSVLVWSFFGACGRGRCWVAAFKVFARYMFADFFSTISHCAWQRVISFSKAKKKRSKENAFTALP